MATKQVRPATKQTAVAAAVVVSTAAGNEVRLVKPSDLIELQQVRVKRTDDAAKAAYAQKVSRMADNLKAVGQINPILVRRDGDNLIIVAGHTRRDAAVLLEWPTVQVIVQETTADARMTIARQMSENMLRDNLTLLDQANGFQTMLISGLFKNAADIAKGTGMSASAISKYLAIAPDGEKAGKYGAMMLQNGFNDLEAAWMVNRIEAKDPEQAKEIAANHAKENSSENRKTIKRRYDALNKKASQELEETDAEPDDEPGEEADPQAPAWDYIISGAVSQVIRALAAKAGRLPKDEKAAMEQCLAWLALVEETEGEPEAE